MSSGKSIRDFFKPSQPPKTPASITTPAAQPSSTFRESSARPARRSTLELDPDDPKIGEGTSSSSSASAPDESTEQREVSTSRAPPPSGTPTTSQGQLETAQLTVSQSSVFSGRIVRSSDDEEDDEDSPLEDLTTIFAPKNPSTRQQNATANAAPSTPSTQRERAQHKFQVSPLAVLPKYKFDLRSLISHAEKDEAAEASSKRVRAMMTPKVDEVVSYSPHGDSATQVIFPQSSVLESVVAEKEDGGMKKVSRALMRTEATVKEKLCYFFDTKSQVEQERRQFPKASVLQGWKDDLANPQLRDFTFISGFAEDVVTMGRALPDELYMWILEEACLERADPLRTAYFNVLAASTEQTECLLQPDILRQMFQRVGAAPSATLITEKIRPVKALLQPYSDRDWSNFRSIVRFVGQVAHSLQQEARTYSITLLLRLGMDQVIRQNVELLCFLQSSISRLCRYVAESEWEACCQEVCVSIFHTVGLPSLRLQIVESIPSTSPRLHDLRRRLSMCFFFNKTTCSLKHSHNSLDLKQFIQRLDHSDFNTDSNTDYREFTSLILLLDAAVDDGRPSSLDLENPEALGSFNKDVDDLVASIKDIMTSIGNPGAAFISRIEAKEASELVSQRIADTVRTMKKPREAWFDHNYGSQEEDLEKEKKGMRSFLGTMNKIQQ